MIGLKRFTTTLSATCLALAVLLPPAVHAAGPVALSVGHADAVAPVYDGGALHLKVKDDTHGGAPVLRDPADVLFHVKAPESETVVPSNPSFAFLGEPGDPVWLLPMTQAAGLLWPGFSSERIASGVLEGDSMNWRLTGAEGPGDVFVFESGAFGAPSISFRSDASLPQSKAMRTGVHAHYNWAFTAPGRYTLTFEVTATAAGGGALSTGQVDYTFVVGGFDDLGVELTIDDTRDRYAPGDTVTLEALQRPRTVLDGYTWSVKCPGDADFAAVPGAQSGVHAFPATLEDEGCQFRVTLADRDGEAIAVSEPVTVHVAIPFFGGRTVLSTGHVDAIAPRYENGKLAVEVEDDTGETPVVRAPSEVVLHAKTPASEAVVPEYEPFAFLGDPGDPVWLLPQIQNDELLWAGFSSESIPQGTFAGDELTWTLAKVDGPGELFLYAEDAVGLPIHRFRSDQPLPQSVVMPTRTHDHFNWAFTAPGRYTVAFEVAGTLTGGSELSSGEVEYEVLVGGYEDLGVRLQVSGADGELVPGEVVTLAARQDPATDLGQYRWFRRCGGDDEWAALPGATGSSHQLTAQAADDGCRFKAAVYAADDREIAESDPVAIDVGRAPDPGPGPGPGQTPDPGPGPGGGVTDPRGDAPPAAATRRPAVRVRNATLRGRSLRLRLHSSVPARATVRILRAGRVVARGKARRVRQGNQTVRFRLDRRLAPGRYRARIRVASSGRAAVRTIVVRVARNR